MLRKDKPLETEQRQEFPKFKAPLFSPEFNFDLQVVP
jgi:hypothetical protein